MKLLLDEGIPLRAAAALRGAGLDATHLLELEMGGVSDETVLGRARADGAIVVTLDADFHQILATNGALGPSVIRIRMEGLRVEQIVALLLDVLRQAESDLTAGAVVSVSGNRARLRRLPIEG